MNYLPEGAQSAHIPARSTGATAVTTGGGAANSAQPRSAELDRTPGSELSRAGSGAGAQEATPVTGKVAAPPDDLRQVEAEIERIRDELGATVQELAARVDVKTRARAKAAEVSSRVKTNTAQARTNATARAGNVRSQVAGTTVAARQKAISAGGAGRHQLQTRAATVGTPVWRATPEQVRAVVTKGANGARERWMPLAIGAGVLTVGCLALRQLLGRRHSTAAPDMSRSRTSHPPGRVAQGRRARPNHLAGPRGERQRLSRWRLHQGGPAAGTSGPAAPC
jgi:hypothetical protein